MLNFASIKKAAINFFKILVPYRHYWYNTLYEAGTGLSVTIGEGKILQSCLHCVCAHNKRLSIESG